MKITTPRYYRIATEIARRIAAGEFDEGEMLRARSDLAAEYGVSSETARRAALVLADLGIVEATQGSGVQVLSRDKAAEFARRQEDYTDVNQLREKLLEHFQRQRAEMDLFIATFEELTARTDRVMALSPFAPYAIAIGPDCPFLKKTLSEVNFWHLTQATVVAVKKGEDLLLSPGPYAEIKAGDILYVVGDDKSVQRAVKCLKG